MQKYYSSKNARQFDLLWKCIWKSCENFFIDMQNVKYIPSDTYFYPKSINV